MKVRIFFGSSDRNNGEDSPAFYAEIQEGGVDFFQLEEVPFVNAAYNVKIQAFFSGCYANGADGLFVAFRVASHPVMGVSDAVQADGKCIHSCGHKASVHFFRVEEAVGNHTPVVAAEFNLAADLVYIGSEKWLSASQDNGKAVCVESLGTFAGRFLPGCFGNGVKSLEEIIQRHVQILGRCKAVAAAVAAREIASQSTFPEKIIQLVDISLEPSESAKQERKHYSALSRTTFALPNWLTRALLALYPSASTLKTGVTCSGL